MNNLLLSVAVIACFIFILLLFIASKKNAKQLETIKIKFTNREKALLALIDKIAENREKILPPEVCKFIENRVENYNDEKYFLEQKKFERAKIKTRDGDFIDTSDFIPLEELGKSMHISIMLFLCFQTKPQFYSWERETCYKACKKFLEESLEDCKYFLSKREYPKLSIIMLYMEGVMYFSRDLYEKYFEEIRNLKLEIEVKKESGEY